MPSAILSPRRCAEATVRSPDLPMAPPAKPWVEPSAAQMTNPHRDGHGPGGGSVLVCCRRRRGTAGECLLSDATRLQFTEPSAPKAYDEFFAPRLFEPLGG